MEWNVKNAVNINVERQHLNKILKEIASSVTELQSRSTGGSTSELTSTITKIINNTLPAGDLATKVTLTGDVVGTSISTPGQNAVTIETTLSNGYLTDAPIDANAYWRFQGSWQAVPPAVQNMTSITSSGYLVIDNQGRWQSREIVSADVDRIVVLNGTAADINTSIDLALVPDGGIAPTLLKVTRDEYGRVSNTLAASASDVPIAKLGSATWDNVQEYINVMSSPGLVEGGGFTDAGSGTLAYSSMRIAIRPTDNDTSTLFMANIAAGSVSIPNDSVTRFVGVQYNSGTPNIVVKTSNTWDYDTDFPLGEVVNLGGTLFPLFNPFKVGDPITNVIQRFDAHALLIRDASGGLVLSTDGTTRNLAMTAGKVWARLNDYPIAARDSPTVPLTRVTPTGGTPPLAFTPGFTVWPNTEYLSGTTLTTMTNNRWAVLWIFVNVGSGAWGYAHGTDQYLNSSAAAQEAIPTYLTQNFLNQNILVGRLIFEKNATTAIIESAFTRVFSSQALSDHNQLSGLQGGTLGQYYHLTSAQVAAVDGAVQSIVAGTNITVDSTDPQNPIISVTGGGGGTGTVDTIVPGGGIDVDATDPANPIVTAVGLRIPAYLYTGIPSHIPLNAASEIPALLANGTVSNIPVIL